jgi:hypothetical protein
MGESNPQLRDAIKKLSAAKYGRPRAEVEREIFARLGAGDAARKEKMEALKKAQQERLAAFQNAQSGAPAAAPQAGGGAGSSFLDEWLAKRQQLASAPKPATAPDPAFGPTAGAPRPVEPAPRQPAFDAAPIEEEPAEQTADDPHKLHIREPQDGAPDEVSLHLRD